MAAKMDESNSNTDMMGEVSQLMQPAEEKLERGEKLELGEAGVWVYSACVRIGAVAISQSDLDKEMVAEGIERAASYIREMDESTVATMRGDSDGSTNGS